MLTLPDFERGLRARGLTPRQVADAMELAKGRPVPDRHLQRDAGGSPRDGPLESPYFWEVFDTLPAQDEEGE